MSDADDTPVIISPTPPAAPPDGRFRFLNGYAVVYVLWLLGVCYAVLGEYYGVFVTTYVVSIWFLIFALRERVLLCFVLVGHILWCVLGLPGGNSHAAAREFMNCRTNLRDIMNALHL